MFAELTPAKVIYDLAVATLTGLLTGLFAGYVIDWSIKRREEQRWLPSKNLMYSHLFQIVEHMIRETLPPDFYKLRYKWYSFGRAVAMAYVDLEHHDSLGSGEEPSPRLVQQIDETMKLEKKYGQIEKVDQVGPQLDPIARAGQDIAWQRPYITVLSKTKEQLDDVFQTYGFLVDPELMSLLARLYQSLITYIDLTSRQRDWTDEDSHTYAIILGQLILQAYPVRSWLDSKVTARTTL